MKTDVILKDKDSEIVSVLPQSKKAKTIFSKSILNENGSPNQTVENGFEIFKKDKNSVLAFLISHNLTSQTL